MTDVKSKLYNELVSLFEDPPTYLPYLFPIGILLMKIYFIKE